MTDSLERAASFRTGLRRFLAHTDAVTSAAGLTAPRYDLLLMIYAAGPKGVRITDLCAPLQMRQTAVTELVRRAEEAGLVERSPSADDGRVWLLHVTPDGKRRMLKTYKALREDRAELTEVINELVQTL